MMINDSSDMESCAHRPLGRAETPPASPRLPLLRSLGAAALFFALFLTAGCETLDQLLSVEAPDRIAAGDLDTPAAAPLLAASVVNEFRCTLSRYVPASALTGMEFTNAVNSGALAIWEQRRHDTSGFGARYAVADCDGQLPALYLPIARTRWLADDVLGRLDAWTEAEVPQKAALTAEVAAMAGYVHVLFGESFCTVTFDSGPEEPRTAAFERALVRFDRTLALQQATPSQLLNLARVGKARALLNLGRTREAAQVAALVPPGFSYTMAYSNADAATRNIAWALNDRDEQVTVGVNYRNLAFAGVPDPRVRVRDKGVTGSGTNIRIWVASKYTGAGSPIRVASWEEAQLIMAEAALDEGRLEDAVNLINGLHSKVGLPPFASTSENEIRAQLVYERRAELFLEGHHLFDITRLGIPLDPAPGTNMEFGGLYGEQLCFQLPAVEFLNNPSISRGGT